MTRSTPRCAFHGERFLRRGRESPGDSGWPSWRRGGGEVVALEPVASDEEHEASDESGEEQGPDEPGEEQGLPQQPRKTSLRGEVTRRARSRRSA